MITKKIESRQECYIQFSEEEMLQLDIKPGDKFTWDITDEGLLLKKHVPVELDLANWDKETLFFLIQESCEKDISVNEVISDILERFIQHESV